MSKVKRISPLSLGKIMGMIYAVLALAIDKIKRARIKKRGIAIY